ncbi:hypothetical protein CHLRE_12g501703v5 [Chlamydomonas reinhardtii]|uniref:F-box domain-containing protein n=1 Tax=Chlamydomonas reinhardtii TaxID=3055 RepID=A0A2K3D367_CHLRE|nr:uncharacterized protein CHLRE_12g501703v5 [Chlamydomonas reinhardtii]PNW74983.1 hypothetical protein CHLRE_12g501703v5 [Chlamydomonas reinhardtii]
MTPAGSDVSQPLPYLPVPIVLGILQRLPPNDIAATARLLAKTFREHFQSNTRVLVSVSRTSRRGQPHNQPTGGERSSSGSNGGPVPPHAAAWWLHTHPPGDAARGHLTLRQRCALRDACACETPGVNPRASPSCGAACRSTLSFQPDIALWRAQLPVPPRPPQPGAVPPTAAPLAATTATAISSTPQPKAPYHHHHHHHHHHPQPNPQPRTLPARLIPPLSPIESYADVPSAVLLAVAARQAPAYAAAAARELLLAAALHGDTDILRQLGALEQVQERAAALAADLAYHAVREGGLEAAGTAAAAAAVHADGQAAAVPAATAGDVAGETAGGDEAPAAVADCEALMRFEVLAWLARADALWRSSDAPFLAAALGLRQRAAAGDEDGGDMEGPGGVEELRRALGRLHAAGFGSFHAAGRTFLAAVDLAARGKVAVELVCWLLDCGCPTGPPGWSYVAAVRPLIDGAASAAASERCLDLAARLARRRVALGPAALSGIAGLPYTGFCSYVSLLVGEYGCPVDRTALYGEVTASMRKGPSEKGAGATHAKLLQPQPQQQQQGGGLPGWQQQEEQQRKLQWLAERGLMPKRLEQWALGRLFARTKERLRGLVGSSDSRGRNRSTSAVTTSCPAGHSSSNGGGGDGGAGRTGASGGPGIGCNGGGAAGMGMGMGGGVAFIETAAVVAAARAGAEGIEGRSRALRGDGAARGKAAPPSTLDRVEELISSLPENLGVGAGDAVGLASAAGRVSAPTGLEEVYDTRATSVLAWDLQVA